MVRLLIIFCLRTFYTTNGENWQIQIAFFKQSLSNGPRTKAKNMGEKSTPQYTIPETARRMLHDNVSIENVIKYTGLTEKEVKALMN